MILSAHRLYEILKCHVGKENAISDGALAGLSMVSERVVIDLADEITRSTGVCVCASCGARSGRYLARDQDEIRDYLRVLRSRALKIFRRYAAVKKARAFQNLSGFKQEVLFEEGITTKAQRAQRNLNSFVSSW